VAAYATLVIVAVLAHATALWTVCVPRYVPQSSVAGFVLPPQAVLHTTYFPAILPSLVPMDAVSYFRRCLIASQDVATFAESYPLSLDVTVEIL
jgi:hypothetical protein